MKTENIWQLQKKQDKIEKYKKEKKVSTFSLLWLSLGLAYTTNISHNPTVCTHDDDDEILMMVMMIFSQEMAMVWLKEWRFL